MERVGYEFSNFEKAVLIMHNGQSLTKQNQLYMLEVAFEDENDDGTHVLLAFSVFEIKRLFSRLICKTELLY